MYEQIRRAHEREGLSIRALAGRFHVHRRDVRAALCESLNQFTHTSAYTVDELAADLARFALLLLLVGGDAQPFIDG